ncbi:MAG TPA: trehalose-phosphatase [Steroidobacteraceae bacterium]
MREPPLQAGRECCLFLDIDGTLVDIAPTPHDVRVDNLLRLLLRSAERACGGALALISGRTIPDIDELFDPLFLPVAGVHGGERRDALGYWHREARNSAALVLVRERLVAATAGLAGVIVEDKGCGLALHYRLARVLRRPLRELVERLAPTVMDTHAILEGDEVIELRPRGQDKGTAVDAFMNEAPFAGRYPIFIGDDLTDHHGFDAVRRRSGLAVAVGSNVNADWHLENPHAVRRWLNSFLVARRAA